MKRWLTGAVALVVAASIAATLGAAATKPYLGSWKAKVGADLLLDNGIAYPQMRGTWRLELNRDGTYRVYNPWDKWVQGAYSADSTRMVFSKTPRCHDDRPGVYRWKIAAKKLKLTSVALGSDPCGGRWQTLAIPLWTRG